AGVDLGERVSVFAKVSEEACDELVQREFVVERLIISRAHVNSASLPKLDPTTPRKLTISSADCVSVDLVTPCEFACTRQTFSDFEIVADDAQHDLRHQLLANRNFTAF